MRHLLLALLMLLTPAAAAWAGTETLGGGALTIGTDGTITASSAPWYRCTYIPATAISKGASDATWAAPDGSTLGGWQLDGATEYLYFRAKVCGDWDGASDLRLVCFVEKDCAGGSANDTIDLKVVSYYKKYDSADTNTQTAETPVTVDDDARYTQYRALFTIDWDKADNVVEEGDVFSFVMNLETDTSECDDVIVTHCQWSYQVLTPSLEIP